MSVDIKWKGFLEEVETFLADVSIPQFTPRVSKGVRERAADLLARFPDSDEIARWCGCGEWDY